MQTVILTELGIVIYKDGKFLEKFPFREPVSDYLAVRNSEAELDDLVRHVSNLDTGVIVSDESLLAILKKNSIDARANSEEENEKIQSAKPEILVESGLAKDRDDAMAKLREFAMQLSSSKVTKVSQSPDLHIIQAINSLDDVDRIENVMSARLREWYGLHFPELDNIIDSMQGYSRIVATGKRDRLSNVSLKDAGFPESKVEMLMLVRDKSRGGDISEDSLSIVQVLARQVLDLHDLRKKIEDHVEEQMRSTAPNTAAILGTAVGARVLAKAGSLKRLARMPASTIQVLGAEKALFRSLKTGARPPKHGLLFQHPLVHAAPRWQRGKIARAIAAKAAIAARVDVYGGEINNTLLDKLNIRVGEIDEKYKNPPEYKQDRDEHAHRGRRSKDRESFRQKSSRDKKSKKKRRKFGRR